MVREKVKVLIVDDEQMICDVLHNELIERGYQCVSVFNGEEALSR
jgi:CheY-like chemotaxis protein